MPNLDVVARQADALRDKWERKVDELPERWGYEEQRLIAESALEDLRKIAANLSRLTSDADGLPTEQDD